MKSLLCKTAIIALSLLAITSVNAWQCKIHNARGQVWVGRGPTRASASAHAMKFCVHHSVYAGNCVMDYCSPEGGGGYMPQSQGVWQCNVANARGQQFIGTGMTRAKAAARAMGFCAAGSNYAHNCMVRACFMK